MQFTTIEFALFFPIVFFLTWALNSRVQLRNLFLGVVSLYFYMCWNPLYITLILFSIGTNYLAGKYIHQSRVPRTRKLWMLIGVLANLGILFAFKYLGFATSTIEYLTGLLSLDLHIPVLKVLLPVGISFYTFQSMSYTLDIYFGKLEPTRSFVDFVTYVAFFPQLVAGPIVRARDFLPQLNSPGSVSADQAGQAFFRIILGLVKKLAISDYIAVNLVDRVFQYPGMFSSLEVLFAAYGYALVIYCDFSAYSDIAIGTARLLGFSLPENFNLPYRSVSVQDFWRRWHISLSTWLRDYLYIPLGGSKDPRPWLTWRNLFLTMLLGGLWHGPSWTFVAWGAFHGIGLAFGRLRGRHKEQQGSRTPVGAAVGVFLTFHFVVFGWILFRAKDFGKVVDFFSALGQLTFDAVNLAPTVLLAMLIGFGGHLIPRSLYQRVEDLFVRLPALAQAGVMTGSIWVSMQVATQDVVPFIYYQF